MVAVVIIALIVAAIGINANVETYSWQWAAIILGGNLIGQSTFYWIKKRIKKVEQVYIIKEIQKEYSTIGKQTHFFIYKKNFFGKEVRLDHSRNRHGMKTLSAARDFIDELKFEPIYINQQQMVYLKNLASDLLFLPDLTLHFSSGRTVQQVVDYIAKLIKRGHYYVFDQEQLNKYKEEWSAMAGSQKK